MKRPVEVTTKYVTTVSTLQQAWAFVMKHLDDVGPRPHVEIRPIHILSVVDAMDDMTGEDEFEVVVEGMVEEGEGP